MYSPALTKLLQGYRQFHDNHYIQEATYEKLVKHGQQPEVLVIACCDSRVDPAILLNTDPGELFMVRNIANLVPEYHADKRHHGTSAALEFSVNVLGVSDIIILGHSHCGGIAALMKEKTDSNYEQMDFVAPWMNIAQPAKEIVLKNYPTASDSEKNHYCEKFSLQLSLSNLKTYPWINQKLKSNEIALHAWYFEMKSGELHTYNATEMQFQPV